MKKISKVLSLTVAASSLLLLSGCHGAKEQKALQPGQIRYFQVI